MAENNTSDSQAAADKATAAAAAADKAAAEEKAAADKAEAARWKGKSYAELAAEHVRLGALGRIDEAAEFHRKFIRTFKDKA